MREIYVKPTVSCKSMTVESRFLVGSPITYQNFEKKVEIQKQGGEDFNEGNPFEIDSWDE